MNPLNSEVKMSSRLDSRRAPSPGGSVRRWLWARCRSFHVFSRDDGRQDDVKTFELVGMGWEKAVFRPAHEGEGGDGSSDEGGKDMKEQGCTTSLRSDEEKGGKRSYHFAQERKEPTLGRADGSEKMKREGASAVFAELGLPGFGREQRL